MTALLLHNVKLIILLVLVGLIVGLSQSAGERNRLATQACQPEKRSADPFK
jgi:hypothetical protein